MNELFNPKGIAVYGSVSPGKLGGILIDQLIVGGRKEHIYAVNPKAAPKGEIPGYAHIQDVPEQVDMAVIAAPAATVPDILRDCGEAGVKAAVIISSGFSEAGNKAGEVEIQDVARQYGIRFIGPNCAGMINTHANLMPTLQAKPPKGGTAVVSQSGAVGGAIMELAQFQGMGVSKFVSYGNGADLNQVEFLRYLKDDPETSVVALYIENVTNGREFMDALKELTAVKPVVALKSGRTSAGQRAALSHTGSMAGSDAVYDAVFTECGAIRVDSLDEMIDLCKGFSLLPDVKGDRLAIVTNSGGPGVMTADLADRLGLHVNEPSEAVVTELKTFLPAWAGFHNPIDMTVEGTGENYRRATETMLREFDAAVAIFFGPPYLDTTPVAEGLIQAFHNAGKPVMCAMETGLKAADSVAAMRASALPNFPSTERAVKVVKNMLTYYHYKSAQKQAVQPVQNATEAVAAPLLEPEAMALLEKNGICTTQPRFAVSVDEAAASAAKIGFPVVMKVVSPKIIHKSDFGGVKLNIANEADARKAYAEIAEAAAGYDFKGVVIYPMIKGAYEVMMGLTQDRQFGPVVAFGFGGIYTEVFKDIALHTAPIGKEEALAMIDSVHSSKILHGMRGKAPANLDALADMLCAFSQLPYRYPTLKEADLNPVFADEKGALTGDVRLIFNQQQQRSNS